MTLQACPRCGADNGSSATACLTCGGALVAGHPAVTADPPAAMSAVGVAPPPPPATAGLPPAPPRRADMAMDRAWSSAGTVPTAQAPNAPSRRGAVVGGIVAAVVALAVGGWFALRDGGGLPDAIGGVPRLDTPEARAFEEQIRSTEFAGITFRGAMYGTAGDPELIVELIDGVPPDAPGGLDAMFDGMAGGFANGSGGAVRLAEQASETHGGVAYRCAPFQASDAAAGRLTGAVCLWQGEGYGLVATLRSDDARGAIADAQQVYEAVH
jgi:hypothetical protein